MRGWAIFAGILALWILAIQGHVWGWNALVDDFLFAAAVILTLYGGWEGMKAMEL